MKVLVNLKPLERFTQRIQHCLQNGQGPARKMYNRWAARYRGWASERFDRLSKSGGGGEWPDLKDATKRARRQGSAKKIKGLHGAAKAAHKKKLAKGGGKYSILRDTDDLYAVLNAATGAVAGRTESIVPFGIMVGYGGPAGHKGATGLSIAELAEVHQEGRGNVPARPIIVDPPESLQQTMARDGDVMVREVIRETDRGD